jgi:hypothetical protein
MESPSELPITTVPTSEASLMLELINDSHLAVTAIRTSEHDIESVDWCCLPPRWQQRLSRKGSLLIVLLMRSVFGSTQFLSRARPVFLRECSTNHYSIVPYVMSWYNHEIIHDLQRLSIQADGRPIHDDFVECHDLADTGKHFSTSIPIVDSSNQFFSLMKDASDLILSS